MRISIFLFIFGLLQVAASSYGQNTKLTIQKSNISLEALFAEIESQSEFFFFYSNENVDRSLTVSVNAQDRMISNILDEALKGTDISYQVIDKAIILAKKDILQAAVQQTTITGTVTDEDGEPMPGVNITIKGTSIGVITDINGVYNVNVSGEDATLVFSFVGYTTEERLVGGQRMINITLIEARKEIEEVVVVGYGTQKKINLTGSVGVASGDEISARPITSISNGLQGLIPGVTVVSYTGQPGASTGTIRIRGIGTIGNANPLILIDGVEGNINLLNPEDIESVSVLKDAASASIYGARGANGVILVTTKSVTGRESKPQINISGYYGFQTPTRLPEMLSAEDYIKLDMEATANVGKPANYTQAHLDKVIDGSDPDYFSNSDWVDAVFRSAAPQQSYNASVTGKGSLMGYYVSYGYLNQEGLTVGNSVKSTRNNIRVKLNTTIASILDVTANIGYTKRNYSAPSGGIGGDNGDGGALYTAISISPVIPVKFQDGRWGYGGGSANPVALLHDSGLNDFTSQEVNAMFTGKINILKNWSMQGTYSFIESNSLREILSRTIHYYRPGTNDIWYTTNPTNKLDERDYNSIRQTVIAQTDYEQKFGKHTINAVAGFSQEWYTEKNFTAQRTSLTTEKNPTLNFGANDTQTNGSSAASWAIRSGFGRINYNFDERYLLEVNLRYDLSSRFAKANRGGLFPSISGAWRISEETFMQDRWTFLSNLKLRASYGVLGNQYVGSNEYPYLAIVGGIAVPRFGTLASDGYTQTTLPNPDLTWETIHMTDIGLDIGLFNNRLNITGDFYVKDTKDILLKLTYPDVLGLDPTEQNSGVVRNLGWEVDVRWNDMIGSDFRYGIGFNLADVHNKITDFGGLAPQLTNANHSIRRVNDPIDAFYGFVFDGIAMPEDFESYNPATGRYENPKFPVLSDDVNYVQPGDLKLKDLDGDGEVDATNDRDVIGSAIPRYTFQVKGDIAWKGFDFSFMLQGVGKANGLITGRGRHAFINQSTYPQKAHLDRWTFENPDPNAKYPRFTFDENYNQRFSTFWMEDASYLRLKNINFGYTFTQPFLDRLKIDKFRIYFSADNLFTATDYFYAFDPESPRTSGGYYPQTKTFVFGFNITFK